MTVADVSEVPGSARRHGKQLPNFLQQNDKEERLQTTFSQQTLRQNLFQQRYFKFSSYKPAHPQPYSSIKNEHRWVFACIKLSLFFFLLHFNPPNTTSPSTSSQLGTLAVQKQAHWSSRTLCPCSVSALQPVLLPIHSLSTGPHEESDC